MFQELVISLTDHLAFCFQFISKRIGQIKEGKLEKKSIINTLKFLTHPDSFVYYNPVFHVGLRGSQHLHVGGTDCHRTDVFFSFHHHNPCHTQSMRTTHPRLHLEVPELEWVSLMIMIIKTNIIIIVIMIMMNSTIKENTSSLQKFHQQPVSKAFFVNAET